MVGRAAGKFWIFRDLERHFATNLTRHIRLWSKYLAWADGGTAGGGTVDGNWDLRHDAHSLA